MDTGTFGNVERSWVYFTRYPFNLGFVYLLSGIFRFFGLFGWDDRFMQVVLVCTALFTLGLLASARVVRRIGGVRAQTRLLVLFASCLPFLYCTTELYTDAFSLAFPAMTVYAFLRTKEAASWRGRILWAIVFALAAAIGAQIRFTSVIAAIACMIALVFEMRGRALLCAGAALIAAFLGANMLMDGYTAQHLSEEDIYKNELPRLHHIAMGLPIHEDEGYGQYGDGGWLIFSTSFEDPDGTFRFHDLIAADDYTPSNALKQAIFPTGGLYTAYYNLCTALFMAQMVVAVMACAQQIRRRKTAGAPLFIALIGIFLVLCAWETKARYFFQFEMVLLCAGALLDSHKKNA